MKFGSFSTQVVGQLSAVAELLPEFVKAKNSRFEYYKEMFKPKAIEIVVGNGCALASVNYHLSPNAEAAKDDFISKADIVVPIKGDVVEGAIKQIMKKEAEEYAPGAMAEISNVKWTARTIQYRDGKIEEMDIVTADCTVGYRKKPSDVHPSNNGIGAGKEKEMVEAN